MAWSSKRGSGPRVKYDLRGDYDYSVLSNMSS